MFFVNTTMPLSRSKVTISRSFLLPSPVASLHFDIINLYYPQSGDISREPPLFLEPCSKWRSSGGLRGRFNNIRAVIC